MKPLDKHIQTEVDKYENLHDFWTNCDDPEILADVAIHSKLLTTKIVQTALVIAADALLDLKDHKYNYAITDMLYVVSTWLKSEINADQYEVLKKHNARIVKFIFSTKDIPFTENLEAVWTAFMALKCIEGKKYLKDVVASAVKVKELANIKDANKLVACTIRCVINIDMFVEATI